MAKAKSVSSMAWVDATYIRRGYDKRDRGVEYNYSRDMVIG